MPELLDVLPADALARVASALAQVANAEARVSNVTANYLAILERTIARINMMGVALDALRMPTSNMKVNAGASAAPTPNAPSVQPEAVLNAIARNTAATARAIAALGKTKQQTDTSRPAPQTTKTPEAGSVSGIGDALANTFGRAKASILDFVGAASPSHFSTLQASITMLSIEIGTVFLPYIEYASRAVQTTARWFRNLDDTTKTNIGRAAMFAVALGGLVIVARQLQAAYVVLRASIIAVNLAMSASPIGAVTKMISAVGMLAAAWWGVNQAVSAANNGMGSGQVPGGRNAAQLELSEPEAAALPEPYRKQYQLLQEGLQSLANYDQLDARKQVDFNTRYMTADERTAGGGSMTEGIRASIRERLLTRGREIFDAFQQDRNAVTAMLPDAQREIVEKNPQKRAEILRDAAAKLRVEALREEQSAPKMAEIYERDAANNRKTLERAAQDPEVLKVLQTQLAAYSNRLGVNPDSTPNVFNDDPRSRPEREIIDKALLRAVQKIDPDTDVTTEALRSIRVTQPNPRRAPEQGGLAVGTSDWVKPFKTLPQLTAQAQTLEARAKLLETAATDVKRGGKDDFAQNIKSPIQSRFTDAFQFAESAQLNALNTGDADAQNLQRQMEILHQSVGNIEKAITQYVNQAQQAAGAGFWRGMIDLTR